jgi:uncharacterized protein (TIGR03067 family)
MVGVPPIPVEPPKELPEAAKKALKTLEGKWRFVKILHFDRESVPGTGEDTLTVEFKGKTINFDNMATGAVVALDAGTDPKCLDFTVPKGFGVLKKGAIYESIYKRNGETLTWAVCVGRGKNRPVAFNRPTDPGVMVMVLTRVKE